MRETIRDRERVLQAIIGMRHVLVHGYYQIKPERLMATIESELPPLRELLVTLSDSLS